MAGRPTKTRRMGEWYKILWAAKKAGHYVYIETQEGSRVGGLITNLRGEEISLNGVAHVRLTGIELNEDSLDSVDIDRVVSIEIDHGDVDE